MTLLTLQQFAAAVGAGQPRAMPWLDHVNRALEAYAITTPARVAAFCAQIGHETAGLHFSSEIWGPTPAQIRYERDFKAAWPPSDGDERNELAYRLGNVNAGDGQRFKGHGLIQVTGRANHARARDRLRLRFGICVPDFEAAPVRLAEMQWACLSAADYWDEHGLNALADAGEFITITRRINGGTNGLADRQARLAVAEQALG